MANNQKKQFNYPTEQTALDRAKQQQISYEKNLLGKTFLFAYVGNDNTIQCIETSFQRKNYLHLTGLDYKNKQTLKRNGVHIDRMDSEEFYDRLKRNDLTLINDISFIKGSTQDETDKFFKYTQHKLDNLSQLTSISNKALFIGKYKGNQNFDIIINKHQNSIAFNKDGNLYIPVSSLNGSAESVATNIKPIVAIFSKEPKRDYQIEFLNSKVNVGKKLLSEDLLSKLNLDSFINPNIKFNSLALDKIVNSYKKTVESNITDKVNDLAAKRNCAFDSTKAMEDYIKAYEAFLNSIDSKEKAYIALEKIGEQVADDKTGLTNDEIAAIKKKFSDIPPSLASDKNDIVRTGAENMAAVQSPVAQLKNKITNFSFLPQRNRDEMYNTNLHGAQIQGNTVALRLSDPKPSLNEIIQNITAQLSEVAQKISDFLSAPLQSIAQEQPSQDRTARGRKINLSIPFTKEAPSQERTEPVTAKSEKAQKHDFKPAEHAEKKMMSWIAKEISSAKREANENNKNHEPKNHDKDQSL